MEKKRRGRYFVEMPEPIPSKEGDAEDKEKRDEGEDGHKNHHPLDTVSDKDRYDLFDIGNNAM